MAKNMDPIVKHCRTLGISPAVMGYSANSSKTNSTKRNPNAQKRNKKSEYAMQLNEKQKVKFIYGILEKQFRMYYEKAVTSEGITGEVLLTTIERRLDNVVFRLGFATTRRSYFKKLKEDDAFAITPKWLDRDKDNLKGKVVAMPQRDDIDYDVEEHLIVELYSK